MSEIADDFPGRITHDVFVGFDDFRPSLLELFEVLSTPLDLNPVQNFKSNFRVQTDDIDTQ